MTSGKRNLDPAFSGNRAHGFELNRVRNLDRQETSRRTDLITCRKAGVLQPVENLIGVHIVTPRDLRNRNARKSRLCADHALLVVTPPPTLSPLPHTPIPVSVHLSQVDTKPHSRRAAERSRRTVT